MSNCWSCGAPVDGLHYMFTCPACTQMTVAKDIRGSVNGQERAMQIIASGIRDVGSALSTGLSRISEDLSTLAGVVQGGFDDLKWELEQQTQVLQSIDATLKSPSQTQAREWREMAEQLRSRGCFDEAQQWFQKSIEMSPLDFRTYVGFAMNHLQKNDFDEAEKVLTKSLPHAPKGSPIRCRRKSSELPFTKDQEVLKEIEDEETGDHTRQIAVFDYKSLSHRLMGRIWACRGDHRRAAAELLHAITLSPEYTEGNYDYALYAVESGETGRWISCLRRAIDSHPGYFTVVLAERRFSPAEQDVRRLLSNLLNGAERRAAQAIQVAEGILADARGAVALAPDPQSEQTSINELTAKLNGAKTDAASGNYVRILKAVPVANKVVTLAKSVAQAARERTSSFFAEKKRRKHEACKEMTNSLLGGLITGLILGVVFRMVGCVGDSMAGTHYTASWFWIGFVPCVIVGAIVGGIRYACAIGRKI